MKIWGSANILSEKEIESIEYRASHILSNIGFRVDHKEIRKLLKESGALEKENILFFPDKIIDEFLYTSTRIDYDFSTEFECSAGAYPQFFLPAGKKTPVLYCIEDMEKMIRLADFLDNIDIVYSGLGIPEDINIRSFELYQKLLRWKYFKRVVSPVSNFKTYHDGPSLISAGETVRYAIEFGGIMAEEEGGIAADYTYGDVYFNSPLYFDRKQAEIFWELYRNGCHCDVGTVMTLGGSAPVTLASALPLQLAEIIFINILQRVFYGIPVLSFASVLAPLDMKKGIFQYGRPELSIAISAMGQLARKYGALFNCCSYFCDAKLPSSEAGMQKTISAISAVYAGSYGIGPGGLLSIDEVISPEQLIIDSEFAGAIKRFSKSTDILEDSEEFEAIKKAGFGGSFIGDPVTAKRFKENWQPHFFSNENLSEWLAGEHRIDTDYATEIYLKMLRDHDRVYIRDTTEKKLLKLIERLNKDN